MKKLQYLQVILVFMILVTGCQKEEEILTEENTVINEEIVTDGAEESPDFKDDVFIDGINQTYLEETGMTREELEKIIEKERLAELENFQNELQRQVNNFSVQDLSSRGGFNFDRGELAGAIGYLLYDIQQNAKKYFSAGVYTDDDGDSTLHLGLSKQLIRNAVAKFPELKQYSRKQKINLYGFSLEDLSFTHRGTTLTIKIKGNARFRWYKKILWKYRKIVDRRGSAHVELPLHFNTQTNVINSGTLKISKINIRNVRFIDVLFPIHSIIARLVIKKFVVIKRDIDLDISYNFLSKANMDFRYFSNTYDDKISFVFDLKKGGGYIYDLLIKAGITTKRVIKD